MSSVRKRGKTWTAQVRIVGWRSFTKTFNKKTDAIVWSKTLEDKIKLVPIPDNDIENLKLKDNSRPKDNSKLYNEIGYQSFLDDLNSIDEF